MLTLIIFETFVALAIIGICVWYADLEDRPAAADDEDRIALAADLREFMDR